MRRERRGRDQTANYRQQNPFVYFCEHGRPWLGFITAGSVYTAYMTSSLRCSVVHLTLSSR